MDRITVLLPPDVNRQIGKLAKKDGRGKSNYIRRLIERNIKEAGKK